VKVEADPALYPVVLITSNSEKALPDAFLRRCVYYHTRLLYFG
jgi:MoxR-like ATPase